MTDKELRDAAVAKLAASWEHLDATTKGATSQKRNPDGTFLSDTTQWGLAQNDYEAALADLEKIGGESPPPPPPPPPPTGVKNSLMTNRISSGTMDVNDDKTKYGYLATNPWYFDKTKPLVDAGVKTLAYKCMSSTRSSSSQGDDHAGGVKYSTADPAWFMTKGGQRIQWSAYSGHWQMDVGSASYQAAWVDQVLANLDGHAGSWSGVIVDNANMAPGSGYFSFPTDQYPDAASYSAATREFLSVVGPQIQAAGYLFIPNIQHHGNSSILTEALWRDWTQFCSGAHLEFYTKWGSAASSWIMGSGWETSGQALMRATIAMGKIFIGSHYCPMNDSKSMNFARASFLLEWDGGPSALGFQPEPPAQDPWSSVWTKNLGLPTGAKSWDGTKWSRNYQGGTVTVNPNTAVGTVG